MTMDKSWKWFLIGLMSEIGLVYFILNPIHNLGIHYLVMFILGVGIGSSLMKLKELSKVREDK